MKVTVIGNGLSRSKIPLEKINGITIGCNEIFEVFTPDYLCIVDYRMMKIVHESDYLNPVYYREISLRQEGLKPKDNWYSPSFLQHNSSGNAALALAISLKASQIDLLGFDCGPGRVLRLDYKPNASFHLWEKNLILQSKNHKGIRRVISKESKYIPEVPSIPVEDYIKELDCNEKNKYD